MEKIEVRIMIASMVISKEFNEEKEAYDFISKEVKFKSILIMIVAY